MGRTRQRSGSRGAAVVEAGLVLPVFLMFVMGIIDFGRYFFIQHSLQFATREGTRLALVGGMLDDGQGGRLSREASVVKTIQHHADQAVDAAELDISIFPVAVDYSDPTGWDDALSAGSAGQYMRVRTEVPFEFITPFIANLVPGRKLEITAEATYRNELFD